MLRKGYKLIMIVQPAKEPIRDQVSTHLVPTYLYNVNE